MNQRILDDAAKAMAKRLLGLRPEEQTFKEFYKICKVGIEVFLLECERQRHGMRPLDKE